MHISTSQSVGWASVACPPKPSINWLVGTAQERLCPPYNSLQSISPRHCEPTGRANARPMTGSAKQSIGRQRKMDCFVAYAPRNDGVDGPRTASMCQTGDVDSTRRREPSMGEISMIGLDLAKNVFQVHGVDASGAVVVRRQLRRGQVEKFFAQLPACTVGLEACGSAHHWARVIGRYGHQVRLMPPAYVKPYVKRNKNDGRDAEAICEAVNRPTMRFVPVKSVEQQATLAVHTARALLVRQRTMLANSLRAALSELGIVAAQGIKGLRELMVKLEAPNQEIPEMMRGALLMLAQHWQTLHVDERALEQQI